MALSENDARRAVEEMSLQKKSAARSSVGDTRLSWNERLAAANTVAEPPLLPFQTPRNEARIITASDIGYSTPKDEQLFDDAVTELFGTCVDLQGRELDVLPDTHLPGTGRQAQGVMLETFIRVAGLAFHSMRTEQVEVVWDEVMNRRGRFDPFTQKATHADLKLLLDTASVHNVMSPRELLHIVPFVTMELRKELRKQPEAPLLNQRERIEQAEQARDATLHELQVLDVHNSNLEREVRLQNGNMPYAPLGELVKAYCDTHQPFNVKEFMCLLDMTVPSVRHTEAISLWSSQSADTEQGTSVAKEVSPEQVTTLLLNVAAAHMVDESELTKRVASANDLEIVTPVRVDPWDTPPSERTSFETVVGRIDKERGVYERALATARGKNALLEAEVQRLRTEQDAREAEWLRQQVVQPDYPPPEVPEELWVVVTGGWEEVSSNGTVRPGVHGPKGKTEGRYTLVGGVDDPKWERVKEPKATIHSVDGVWVVSGEGGPVITSTAPHSGWRPHEVDTRWVVSNDKCRAWHVHVTAEEQRDEGMVTGLCSICKTKIQAQRLGLYELEMEGDVLRGDVTVLQEKRAGVEGDMQQMLKSIEVYQDNTEAPPVPRNIRWGTGGEYEHVIAPKWTGGRPPDSRPYHRLPAPRPRDPIPPSRQSAVYSQLAHIRDTPPTLRRPTPVPLMYNPTRLQPASNVSF